MFGPGTNKEDEEPGRELRGREGAQEGCGHSGTAGAVEDGGDKVGTVCVLASIDLWAEST